MQVSDPKQTFLSVCSMPRLETILGSKERAGKFLSDFVMLCEKNKNQKVVDIANCAIEIASMNLSILPQSGQVYIVPRSGVINVEIGYKGWLVLAKRAGVLVRCYPIFKGDDYTFEVDGFEQKFHLKPSEENLFAEKNAKWVQENLQCMAVITKDREGEESVNLISRELLERLRSKGTANSPAYKDWLLEMYQAKAIKYVLRKTPIDSLDTEAVANFNNALSRDDRNDVAFEKIEASKTKTLPLNDAFASAKVTPELEIKEEVINYETGEVISQSVDFESLIENN